jgi:hypothetical protein
LRQIVPNRFRTGSEQVQNRLRTDSEIFKQGIVEKFSCNFLSVEYILMLYIGPFLGGFASFAMKKYLQKSMNVFIQDKAMKIFGMLSP